MALQFQAPSFVKPTEYQGLNQLPQTLDSIINAYLMAKKEREAKDLASKESLLKYGFDISQTTPEEIVQGRQMAPQHGPDQAGLNPRIAAIRDMYRKQFAQQDLSTRAAESDIALTQAKTQEALRTPEQRGTVNRPPQGYRFLPTGDLEPIPGGPADLKIEQTEGKRRASLQETISKADTVKANIDAALKLVGPTSAGFLGGLTENIGGSPAANLSAKLDTIASNLGFQELQKMRANSPTGGALGQVAVRELDLLQSTVDSLKQNQSPEQLRQALENIKRSYDRWAQIAQQDLQSMGPTPSQQTQPIALPADKAKRLMELRAKMGRK